MWVRAGQVQFLDVEFNTVLATDSYSLLPASFPLACSKDAEIVLHDLVCARCVHVGVLYLGHGYNVHVCPIIESCKAHFVDC